MKILLWGEVKNGGPYDIKRRLDYSRVYEELKDNYHANCMNVGNKVWIQGLVSELSTNENELFFYNPRETWDEINSKYDKIVYSAANMFNKSYVKLIDFVANLFRNSKIPVYVVAIGAQAESYDCMSQLVNDTKKSVSNFVDSIYSTGGEIACRGYFTKEYLDKVVPNSAVVTGCPSLFQNGNQLKIEIKNGCLNPVFNGNAPFINLSAIYKDSIYIDQDAYLGYTYDLASYNVHKYIANMVCDVGWKNALLFAQGKVKIFWDVPEWKKFLQNGSFNISIGSRIHGNIMALLSGVPALIYPTDSRVREMAEFYNIPVLKRYEDYYRLDKVVESLDYTKFNKSYPQLFKDYELFLQRCGLVKKLNQKNVFWNRELPVNRTEIEHKVQFINKKLKSSKITDKIYYRLAWLLKRLGMFKEFKNEWTVERYP
jgi:hypothetical protein